MYQPDFLTPEEEAGWIGVVEQLPLEAMRYKQYTARRRVISFGGRYDFDDNRLAPAAELPQDLWPLRRKVADWSGCAETELAHVLVAAYDPGTPLGWHRDVPEFEDVVGVSLQSEAVMKFRPSPPSAPSKSNVVSLVLAPRSIYRLSGTSRWGWQHSVAPTPALRYSITFRTRRLRQQT